MRLKDKVALVTGGAQAIGLGIASRLACEGASVMIVDLNGKRAELAAQKIRNTGGQAFDMTGQIVAIDGGMVLV